MRKLRGGRSTATDARESQEGLRPHRKAGEARRPADWRTSAGETSGREFKTGRPAKPAFPLAPLMKSQFPERKAFLSENRITKVNHHKRVKYNGVGNNLLFLTQRLLFQITRYRQQPGFESQQPASLALVFK